MTQGKARMDVRVSTRGVERMYVLVVLATEIVGPHPEYTFVLRRFQVEEAAV
jgi:hypothetical protein